MPDPLHRVTLLADGGYEISCPYPPNSITCGLIEENLDHDEDACAANEEGDDGCGDSAGWVRAPGCAVIAVAYGNLGTSEMWADERTEEFASQLPIGVSFSVIVTWDGYFEDAEPRLSFPAPAVTSPKPN